ncbi:extracellular solute-binding protein [Halalkalibacter kiskunsagensis]|uniref:Extracellular solute-binding protein n=1 Tax=Halalkalibacter kiskunsagensis TaxID=1548599 RepID=A0ABV6KGE2_9BACI
MRKRKRSKLSLFVLLALITAFIVACSSNKESSTDSSNEEAPDSGVTEEPLDISMSLNFDGTEVPAKGNDVQVAIEEYTNTTLDITHMVSANFCERLPVLIASGDLPDVIASCGAPNQPYLISAMQDGVFWEIGQYLDQFPNLSSMNDVVYDNVKVNDGLYGIPRYRPLNRWITMYRQDWLDNLGLEVPTNFEEYKEVLKAFTNEDPNQSGEKDTRGTTSVALPGGFGLDFGVAFGAPHNWMVADDGTFIKNHETPEYFEALKYAREMFEEGVVNSDLVAPDQTARRADFENGVIGFWGESSNTVQSFVTRLKENDPDAEVGIYNALVGPTGEKRLESQMGSNGILMFPKATVKTEEHLLQLLAFFEKLSEQEMVDLLAWGIEGVHHEIVDGVPKHIDYDKYMAAVGFPYRYPLVTAPLEDKMTPGELSELEVRVQELEIENSDLVVADPTVNLISEVQNQLGADLEQLINDAKYKFVTGAIDEDGWHDAIQTWKDRGGDDIRADYERLYEELN